MPRAFHDEIVDSGQSSAAATAVVPPRESMISETQSIAAEATHDA